jgi:hypothetical protein
VLRDYPPSHADRVRHSGEWGHCRVVRHHSHSVSYKGETIGQSWRAKERGIKVERLPLSQW